MLKNDNLAERNQVAAANWLVRAFHQKRGMEKRARDYVQVCCTQGTMSREEAKKLAKIIAKPCPMLAAELITDAIAHPGFRIAGCVIAPWTVQYERAR